MSIISTLISLPISIILIVWLIRSKRNTPFTAGNVVRLIIAGIVSALVGSTVTILFTAVRAIKMIGLDTLKSWFANPDPETIQAFIDANQSTADFSYGKLFLSILITVGLAEGLSRYLFLRLSTRRKDFAKTSLDFAICGGIVGTGFTIVEDLLYSSGGAGIAIFRSLMPFHFTFGAIMGYFIGKAYVTGRKGCLFIGILIPVLLHTLFDSSIFALTKDDSYLFLFIAAFILLIAVTIVMIVKIHRWKKEAEKEESETESESEFAETIPSEN